MDSLDNTLAERRPDLKTRLIIKAVTKLLGLWFSTCRIELLGKEYHDQYIESNRKVVGGTWHRGAIFLVWFYGPQRPMIMFSRSRDGDLLADFARSFGVEPIRGSSRRGGMEALESMKHFLMRPGPNKAATVLDGPRGPRCLAKKGMIVLAKETGIPLLPIIVSAKPAFTFKKAWDRTILPLPFSRVVVSYRKPWDIPSDLDAAGLEELRQEVETTLNDMMAEADEYVGYSDS